MVKIFFQGLKEEISLFASTSGERWWVIWLVGWTQAIWIGAATKDRGVWFHQAARMNCFNSPSATKNKTFSASPWMTVPFNPVGEWSRARIIIGDSL